LAITGSNGKTTTKELIAAVLSKRFHLVCTQGNLNNHIGVPLTLLSMDNHTEMAVVEMGANHPGEIKNLCALSDPDYGIITNIGRAHLEGFGSFDAIKKTKAELYDHIRTKQGTIFYNGDNPVLEQLAAEVPNKVRFGEKEGAITGHTVVTSPYVHVEVNFPGESRRMETKLIGRYNFENILAASCIGHYFQVEPAKIQSAIAGYTPENNRSQLIEKNGLKLIMDAYNANPTSMQASIDSFVSEFSPPRYLMLGDMLELGRQSLKEHQEVLQQIKKHPVEKVFLVGPVFSRAAQNSSFLTFPDSGALGEYLKLNPIDRGTVLLKASRGIQIEKVIAFL
jgi:UDP-N-acetylmuramoyl-tripeptide--D-alanyl-D-alanine ligase